MWVVAAFPLKGCMTPFSFLQCTSLRSQCFLCGDNFGLRILHLLACISHVLCRPLGQRRNRIDSLMALMASNFATLVLVATLGTHGGRGVASGLTTCSAIPLWTNGTYALCLGPTLRLGTSHQASTSTVCHPLQRRFVSPIHEHKTNAQTMTAFCFGLVNLYSSSLFFFRLYSLVFHSLFLILIF